MLLLTMYTRTSFDTDWRSIEVDFLMPRLEPSTPPVYRQLQNGSSILIFDIYWPNIQSDDSVDFIIVVLVLLVLSRDKQYLIETWSGGL